MAIIFRTGGPDSPSWLNSGEVAHFRWEWKHYNCSFLSNEAESVHTQKRVIILCAVKRAIHTWLYLLHSMLPTASRPHRFATTCEMTRTLRYVWGRAHLHGRSRSTGILSATSSAWCAIYDQSFASTCILLEIWRAYWHAGRLSIRLLSAWQGEYGSTSALSSMRSLQNNIATYDTLCVRYYQDFCSSLYSTSYRLQRTSDRYMAFAH